MATETMLRPRNTRKWVHKSGVKRLTMHSVLFSLWSRGAVPRRWDSRMLFGALSGAWQRARLAIRSDLAEKTLGVGQRSAGDSGPVGGLAGSVRRGLRLDVGRWQGSCTGGKAGTGY